MKTTTKKIIYLAGGMLLIILVVVVLLVKYNTDSDKFRNLEEIIHSGKLHVVSENSSIGFNIEKDSISGFQYEILKIFANSLGIELEISIKNDLNNCINDLNKGKYDIIAKFVPITTEWNDIVLFSEPLLISRQMLVQRISEGEETGTIEHQYQLANDSIFIPLHSPHKMRLQHLSDEIADTIYIVELKNQNSETLAALVSEGKIRNTICHEQLSRKFIRQYSNLDASVPVSLSQPYGWIVNKESEDLLKELNDFLSSFIESREYWNLYRKYYVVTGN